MRAIAFPRVESGNTNQHRHLFLSTFIPIELSNNQIGDIDSSQRFAQTAYFDEMLLFGPEAVDF
jgi:hypothetical protein